MKGALKDAEAREYLGASTRAWKRIKSLGLVRPVPIVNAYRVIDLDCLLQSLSASREEQDGGRQAGVRGRPNGSYSPPKAGKENQPHPLD